MEAEMLEVEAVVSTSASAALLVVFSFASTLE